ncbi:MAG: hypothetical protein M3342_05800 [Bacteroidota bacterium]|nr:hypothetical protein [Flavisolibacter sp.]MBD0351353.1 hypothetical protein [Flavisolibacter sp.]MDQ3843513.1 hypothetical protein [Bacteroidota bacterium]
MAINTLPDKKNAPKNSLSHLFLSIKGPEIVVWTIWAGMLLFALTCVFIYGHNIPIAEDWHMVAPLTGNEPKLIQWLWAQNNEHRIPLPKMILLLLLKSTHGDFRSGMFLNILAIAFLAALLIYTFYKFRGGKTKYTDAFFPLVLLNIGHWENFYWSWEFTFILATILFCFLIINIIRFSEPLSRRPAITTALCSVLLPLCGANGLLYLLPVIPWLAYISFLHLRSRKVSFDRQVGFILISGLITALILSAIYFIGYERPYWNPPSPSIKDTIITSIKFMALGFGPSVSDRWNIFMLAAFVLISATSILLVYALFQFRGIDFTRALGLFLFLGGMFVFALAMGYGRAASVAIYGFPLRYVLLSVPIVIICYSGWELFGSFLMKNLIQWSLVLSMMLLLIPNTKKGFGWRNWYLDGVQSVTNDIKVGVPHAQLAERHQKFLLHWDKQMLYTLMQQLKEARMGPFQYMKEDAPSNTFPQ